MPRTTVDTDIGSRACQRQDTTTPSAQTSPLPSRSPRPHLGRTSPPKAPRQPDPRPARRASPKPSRSPRKYPSLLHSRRLFDSPQPEGTVRVLIDKALRGYVLSPLAAPGPAGSGWFSVRSSIGIAEAGPLRAAVEATPSFTYKRKPHGSCFGCGAIRPRSADGDIGSPRCCGGLSLLGLGVCGVSVWRWGDWDVCGAVLGGAS